jgi:hypothetical protein
MPNSENGRSRRIRTFGLLVPNQTLYQAKLHSVKMVLLQGTAPCSSDYQSLALLLCYRRKGAGFCPRNRKRPFLKCTGFIIPPDHPPDCALLRGMASLQNYLIKSSERFCSGNCPFLNGSQHRGLIHRLKPVLNKNLSHSFM